MYNKREIRFCGKDLQVSRSTDGKQTISGYGAVFNSLSQDLGGYKEKISPGAFSRSLAEKADVLALSEHDRRLLLGRTRSGTLRLNEDTTGLHFEVDLPPTQLGNDVATQIARGDLDGCSFSFIAKDVDWDQEGQIAIRTLLDLDLLDVSVVSQPAYPSTSVQLRSLMFPDGEIEVPKNMTEVRAATTKKVDGEDLTAGDFLIVGDPDKTDTWKLPWKFSDEEKTKSHLRNALARFDQLQGVSSEDKAKARAKLVSLCKSHGIDVTEEKSKKDVVNRAMDDGFGGITTNPDDQQPGNDSGCECPCEDCLDNRCEECSNQDCDYDECRCGNDSIPPEPEDMEDRTKNDLLLASVIARRLKSYK